MFVCWYLNAGLEDFLSGSDVGQACEQDSLFDGSMNVSQQTSTLTWTLPHSAPMFTWSSRPHMQTALQASGQSDGDKGGLIEGARQSGGGVLSCPSLAGTSVMTSQLSAVTYGCHADTEIVTIRGRLSSGVGASHHSTTAGEVKLQPAETSDVVSSAGDVSRQRASTAIELGNMHLRDLLSQDDGEPDGSGESPQQQQPQSTSCDDPPDSSTGNVRSGSETSILKQLLSDSDMDEHNEASVGESRKTHTDDRSHVLLKVCVITTVLGYF